MEREFPSVSFPYSFPPHETKRELFADFGTCGQLDVDKTGDCTGEFLTQRLANSSMVDLCASHPTLPLSPCPTAAIYPFSDRVNDRTVQIWKAWNDILPRLRISKSLLPTFKREYLTQIIQGEPVRKEQWFSDLLEKYHIVSAVSELPTSNSQYTGGGLCYLPCADDGCQGYLISASGRSFSSIKIQSVQNSRDRILQSQELSTLPASGHIYQTVCNNVHNKDFCAVRLDCSCIVYTFNSNEDRTAVELIELGQKICSCKITAISLSPYIPSECLITTEDGSCLLWNSSQSTCEEVVSARSPRFHCHDPWRHAHFGSHPRQLVYADPAAVELYDLRKMRTGSVDLFCLPSKFLHKRERIRGTAAQSVSSFYHLIATDYSLILLDERFPGYPVLQWQHLLKSPPRYLSVSPYSARGVHTVFVGSQYPPEVVCMRYQHQGGLPPQAISVPWRASKKSDFIYWPGFASGPDKYLAEERLNLSLAGQAVSTTDSEITLFQMDSLGDIFYQVYGKRQSEKEDVTFSAGPGSCDLQLSDVAMTTGKDWLENLIKQKIQNGPEPEKYLRADSSQVFGAVIKEKLVHCFCVLCFPTHKETSQLTSHDEMICQACTHSLETARKIAMSTKKDCILDADDDNMRLLESQLFNMAEENHQSATSKLLKKLWDGDPDIQDILVEKDNEFQEIRKERQKQKQIMKSGLGLIEKLLKDVHQCQDDVSVGNEEANSDNGLHGDQLSESSEVQDLGTSHRLHSNDGHHRDSQSEEDYHGDIQAVLSDPIDKYCEPGSRLTPLRMKTRQCPPIEADRSDRQSELDNSFENSMDDELKLSSPCLFDSDVSLINRTPQASPRRRKRHSSMSSVGSVLSQRSSSSIPGFGVTPLKQLMQHGLMERSANISVSSPVTGRRMIGVKDKLASSGTRSPFAISVSNLQCQGSDGSETSELIKGDQSRDQNRRKPPETVSHTDPETVSHTDPETVSHTDPEFEFFSQSQECFTIFSSQSQLPALGQSKGSAKIGARTMSPLKKKQKSVPEGF